MNKQNKKIANDTGAVLEQLRVSALKQLRKIPNGSQTLTTAIPYLSFICYTQPTDLNTGMLEPSMCLVIQGGKKILIGNDIIRYGAGSYLVSAIDMPTSGQVTIASRAVPYVGLRIDWRPEEISGLMLDMQIAVPDKLPASVGAAVNTADTELQDALLRLVRLLDKPRDIPALAPLIKREILYRLLTASGGSTLYQSLLAHHQERGVNAAIQWIKKNFDQPMTIESLASAASMSASTLHRHFKAITTISPLQYQKQVRLLEARKLLFTGNVEAATAAFRVGYESPSQFSREYRRLFGATPVQDSKVSSSFAL